MDLEYASENFDIPEMLTLTTPINATDAYTFGIPPKNVSAVCISNSAISGVGIWAPDRNLTAISVFFLQLSLSSFLTSTCKFLLKPLGEASIVAQILSGIIGGPSVLARSRRFLLLVLPFKSMCMLETLSSFGCILFLFLVGVRMDITMMRKSGKREWAIGLSTFIFPMGIILPASSLIGHLFDLDENMRKKLPTMGLLFASTTFHGICCFLEDLNLLNSELGRLAMSSSTISGFLCYGAVLTTFAMYESESSETMLHLLYSAFGQMLVIWFAIQPLLIWIVKHTSTGRPIKEVYLCFVVFLVLAFAFISEFLGQHGFFAPILLGMVLPDGSFLAATINNKLETFVSFIMLPLYFLACGVKTNLVHLSAGLYFAIQLLGLLCCLTKFATAVFVSVFYCNMVLKDAITLGLILSTIGLMDIHFYSRATQLGFLDFRCFGTMNTSAMIITGCISPIVKALYDPSVRYTSCRKRTVLELLKEEDFRIMVCIHKEEQVPGIINLLEASNPTRNSRINLYLLHLVELVGRSAPLFVRQYSSVKEKHSLCKLAETIFKALSIFQQRNEELVTLETFTAVAPLATMHDDVCTLALDKGTCLIIVCFHKQLDSSGTVIETSRFRTVNLHVLDRAPCSVGILIDRGNLVGPRMRQEAWSIYRVGVLFIGGPDDREAVAYSTRMAAHPNVNVTIVRFAPVNKKEDMEEKLLDGEAINHFRRNATKENAIIKEETAVDSVGVCGLIRSMEDAFDLILVGRRTESPILEGLSEWNQNPELGSLGDLLASRDFRGNTSILVIQQQQPPREESYLIYVKENEKVLKRQGSSVALSGSQEVVGSSW